MPAAGRTTTERGLGHAHQQRKRVLMTELARTGPRPCRRCGQDMVHPSQCEPCWVCRLDLGHPEHAPRALGGQGGADDDLEHAHCNRVAGAQLGVRLRGSRVMHNPRW